MKFFIISITFFMMNMSVLTGKAQTVTTIAGPDSNINDAIIFDDEGNIYGSYFDFSYNEGAVYKISTNGTISVFSEGYSACNGLDFDSEGNLYVVDFTQNNNNHQIYKLNSEGEKTPYGPTIYGASNILFDPLSDTCYVSQYYGNKISKLAPDGELITFCDASELNGPVGMAFDDDNNFYVANFNNGKIYSVDDTGTELSLLADIQNISYWGVGFITYSGGYLYATGIGVHKIFKISLTGDLYEFAGSGTAGLLDGDALTAQFNKPNGIAANPAGDKLYISDNQTQAIREITDLSATVENLETQTETNNFKLYQNYPNPAGQTTEISYELFKNSHVQVQIFSEEGKLLKTVVNAQQTKGIYKIDVNISDFPAGMYFYRLTCDGISVSKKMNIKP